MRCVGMVMNNVFPSCSAIRGRYPWLLLLACVPVCQWLLIQPKGCRTRSNRTRNIERPWRVAHSIIHEFSIRPHALFISFVAINAIKRRRDKLSEGSTPIILYHIPDWPISYNVYIHLHITVYVWAEQKSAKRNVHIPEKSRHDWSCRR